MEPVAYDDGTVRVLDQTRLPSSETYLELRDDDQVAEAIRSLRVRGAPVVGITAAYGLAAAARRAGRDGARRAAEVIRVARPTAVNLAYACDRVLGVLDGSDPAVAAEDEARAIHAFEITSCLAMGRHGASLLPHNARVMTYCNTGALATGGIGTAFGVGRTAFEDGALAMLWVPETRPLLQGARLTAWEATRLGMPFRLLTEAATGSLFAAGDVDAVVVGADRIARNGDTANKIGTYVLAVLAARHGVPFYVVAPTSTVDAQTPDGSAIPIEERPPDELRSLAGVPTAPAGARVRNPAFDVTPAGLITAIVTERQVHAPPYDLGSR